MIMDSNFSEKLILELADKIRENRDLMKKAKQAVDHLEDYHEDVSRLSSMLADIAEVIFGPNCTAKFRGKGK